MTTQIEELKAAHRATWAAGDYAAVADRFVLEVGRAAVARADLGPGLDVLDVATGSGNAAIPAAVLGARVVGLDLVPELLAVARRRAEREVVEVEWVEGDAEALPFADASFDRVLSVLGIQFAPRHEVGARELARVLRPGGLLVLCSWAPEGLIGQFFAAMAPRLPKPPAGASPPPLWGDAEHVSALFAGAGVPLELEFETRSVVFEHDSPAAFVDYMATDYGPLRKARERLEPEGAWADLRADLIAVCERANLAPDGFMGPSTYLLARGRRGA
jgi:SAM-dependent methyltransferase